MIPYGRQSIDAADVEAVVEVLHSNWLTQGPAVPRFEQALADYCGASHAVAVSNATAALHLACLALGVGAGDRVWTSPNTFVASANCALYCGAQVDFVDIDADTGNMAVSALEQKLEAAAAVGALPKVVIPVHFSGQPCDMAEIAALGRRYGFRIIEDAAHALGAEYQNGRVGDGRFADIAIFSFHPVKLITTGEGGAALTNDVDLARRLRLLRSHGITRDTMADQTRGDWYYEQVDLGYNFRLTDIQAALGASQLSRLDGFLARRRELAGQYDGLLSGLPVRPLLRQPGRNSSWHLYVVRVAAARRRAIFDAMRKQGVQVHVHYIPVCNQPYYRNLGFGPGTCPEADRYYAEALTLPLFPLLDDDSQRRVVDVLARS